MTDNIKKIADRCLNCKTKSCMKACPLHNDIPGIMGYLKEGKEKEAMELLGKTSAMPEICSIVCNYHKNCEKNCLRGINGKPVEISKVEEYLGKKTNEINNEKKISIKNDEKKVAIIGGGPAGLTCATFLVRYGIQTIIYEERPRLGGILQYGIPEYRLSRKIVENTVNKIIKMGVEYRCNKELGKNLFLEDLMKNYQYIFLAMGANISKKMHIEGEELQGVYGGVELLENIDKIEFRNKKVIIVGGGDVSVDCARSVLKKGASDIKIMYRNTKEKMPVSDCEKEKIEKEGIEILYNTELKKIFGNDKVEGAIIVKKEDDNVRRTEREYEVEADYVVESIGRQTNFKLLEKLGLELDTKGYVKVNPKYQTSTPNIFAGGDLTGKTTTVASASKTGREVAEIIRTNLKIFNFQ